MNREDENYPDPVPGWIELDHELDECADSRPTRKTTMLVCIVCGKEEYPLFGWYENYTCSDCFFAACRRRMKARSRICACGKYCGLAPEGGDIRVICNQCRMRGQRL